MSVGARVRAANKPGPPEHSILLRVAAAATVAIGIAACAAEGELSAPVAAIAIVALTAGNVFSYLRRNRPFPWLKVVLAVVAVVAFWHFFFTISAAHEVTNLSAVEGPLAVLFTWIQVTHAFDVPSRKDLAFSLAGSVTLMAAAAAQAIDMTFAPYVVAWALFAVAGLGAMWGSVSGSGRPRPLGLVTGAAVLLVVAVGCVIVLPAPSVSSRLVFPSAISGDVPLSSPAGLEGTGSGATLPVQAGSPNGPVAVGGYLGFAGPLDTAVRGSLGNQVVMRVRADRPTFWVAETFDHWDGQSWTEAPPSAGTDWHQISGSSPFDLGPEAGPGTSGSDDVQTFYLAQAGPNLIFHAERTSQVWFPALRLYVDRDGNVRSGTSMGKGTIYTVVSSVETPTVSELDAASGPGLDPTDQARFTELPHPYPRVAALAARITADETTTEGKVLALEAWMGAHTHYTTDIPPLPNGADTVDEFLFGNRRGFCEQISTSLAVMLRTLGIPAREATGYVPGPYNPITDLYQVQAKDAHAWVQVWFPGYGWQSFDPTASVPLATPSPAATLGHEALGALRRVPAVPVALVLGALVAIFGWWSWRRRRPATPAAAVGAALVATARRAGLEPKATESLSALGARIDAHAPPPPGRPGASAMAEAAESAAFGGLELAATVAARLVADAKELRRRVRGVPPVRVRTVTRGGLPIPDPSERVPVRSGRER